VTRGALAAAVLATGLVGLVACGDDGSTVSARSTDTAPAQLPTAAQARAALLTADDLGPGWTPRSVPAQGDTLCGVTPVTPGSPVRGRSGFQRSPAGPFVVHRFVGFPPGGAVAAMAALRDAIADCDETEAGPPSQRVTWSVRSIEPPPAGDDSIGVRLTTGDAGNGLPTQLDEVVFRRGEFVGLVAHAAVGDLDPALSDRAVRAADRRLLVLAGG
jgi:hypothetical protein